MFNLMVLLMMLYNSVLHCYPISDNERIETAAGQFVRE
jgi:hypothetical protein